MPEPALSVVINTYNKAATLERVLRALLEQQGAGRDDYELVVYDDGSTDDTRERVAALAAAAPLRIVYASGPNVGVSAARNAGVRLARGEHVLLMGDDIVASPALLREHLEWQARQPGHDKAIVGPVMMPPELDRDPFLHWLDNGGPQFHYWQIDGRVEIGPRYFYACNVSLPRRALLEHPFDPAIAYGFEDRELGHRLERAGFRFYFNRAAIGFHHHPRTFRQFRRRQLAVGGSLYAALRNHPDLLESVPAPRFPARRRVKLLLRAIAFPLARVVGARRQVERYWRTRLDLAVYRGYLRALRSDRDVPPHLRRAPS